MKVKVIRSPLNLRTDHNTASSTLTSFQANVILNVDQPIFTASQQLSNSAGVYQKVGDKWAHVVSGQFSGWVAVVHMGTVYSEIIEDATEPVGDIEIVKAVVYYKNQGSSEIKTQELLP